MKELSDETLNRQEPVRPTDGTDTPAHQHETRDSAPEVYAFDGWGLVPVDLHIV